MASPIASVLRLFDDERRVRLLELRRDLHRHPELSGHETRTSERLYQALAPLRPASVDRCRPTGIVARISGRDPGAPVVAVRGDIDALPIEEETGLDYASEVAGVMHACGHDVHATWAVAAAELLTAEPAAGDVLVVLQPAEEIGTGARQLLDSGALADVRAIFGAHVDRRFAVGEVVVQSGPLAAAADEFEIVIRGVGGHGARPHLCRDPIVAAAALISDAQTLVSRRVEPGTPCVVTFGMVQAGRAFNVIPEEARLGGTVRTTDPEIRRQVLGDLDQLVQDVGRAHRVDAALSIRAGTPPLINSERAAGWCQQAAVDLLGEGAVVPLGPVNMGGEDFAFYLEEVEGCFVRVGAREPGGEPIGAHNPHFHAADDAIFVGGALLAEAARRASEALASERGSS